MKKRILALIILGIILLIYILLPHLMSIGKYEYLTTSFSPYEEQNKEYSKYALLITEDKYYIYNKITRTYNKDYSTFIKNTNSKYMDSPNVCSNSDFIDYESGVKCNISDKYLKIYLWYKEDGEKDSDAVYIDNKGNVKLIQEKENYRFGKYKGYGLFYEVNYGNYEITLTNGSTYLISGIDSEERWNTFELNNKDEKGNWILESDFEKFYISGNNAIFLARSAVINPLSEKIEIGENYYDYDEPKVIAEDIYKDKYILVSNNYYIEVRDIKNNIISKYKTNSENHDLSFQLKEDIIYIYDDGKDEQIYIFNEKNIIKSEN